MRRGMANTNEHNAKQHCAWIEAREDEQRGAHEGERGEGEQERMQTTRIREVRLPHHVLTVHPLTACCPSICTAVAQAPSIV
jgi:hypothetical protein